MFRGCPEVGSLCVDVGDVAAVVAITAAGAALAHTFFSTSLIRAQV